MIKASSRIKLNMPGIKKLNQTAIAALEQTADALREEVRHTQVMPRDTGTLQNESTFVDTSQREKGTVSIVSSTPYARRLYFHPEYHFQKDENPNAKGHWYEDWEAGGKYADFCQKTFKEIYRRLAGL